MSHRFSLTALGEDQDTALVPKPSTIDHRLLLVLRVLPVSGIRLHPQLPLLSLVLILLLVPGCPPMEVETRDGQKKKRIWAALDQ